MKNTQDAKFKLLQRLKNLVSNTAQDMAVSRYYKEIRGHYDPQTANMIYEYSENVKAMGGADAIHNACATRIFCP